MIARFLLLADKIGTISSKVFKRGVIIIMKEKMIASIIEIVVGAALVIASLLGVVDEFWSGMGTSLLIIGILFLIFGFKGALFKAIVIAAVDMLPVIGVGTVLIPWAVFAAVTADFSLCFKLIFIYLLVTIVRNMAEPKILGKQMGLHPVITLLTVFVGLKLFGVIGMFVLPLSVTVLTEYFKEQYRQGDKLKEKA